MIQFLLTILVIICLSVVAPSAAIKCYVCGMDMADEALQDEKCEVTPPPDKYAIDCQQEENACTSQSILSSAGTIDSITRGCAEIGKKSSLMGCRNITERDGRTSTTCNCDSDKCNGMANKEMDGALSPKTASSGYILEVYILSVFITVVWPLIL